MPNLPYSSSIQDISTTIRQHCINNLYARLFKKNNFINMSNLKTKYKLIKE